MFRQQPGQAVHPLHLADKLVLPLVGLPRQRWRERHVGVLGQQLHGRLVVLDAFGGVVLILREERLQELAQEGRGEGVGRVGVRLAVGARDELGDEEEVRGALRALADGRLHVGEPDLAEAPAVEHAVAHAAVHHVVLNLVVVRLGEHSVAGGVFVMVLGGGNVGVLLDEAAEEATDAAAAEAGQGGDVGQDADVGHNVVLEADGAGELGGRRELLIAHDLVVGSGVAAVRVRVAKGQQHVELLLLAEAGAMRAQAVQEELQRVALVIDGEHGLHHLLVEQLHKGDAEALAQIDDVHSLQKQRARVLLFLQQQKGFV
eukprot:m.82389 g.82389  ORF g.82389 m.82389 type:complete len:317 (+) comp14913_c0_seq1:474-1424(+)